MRRNDVDRGSLVSRRDPQISRNIGTGGSPIYRKIGDGVPNFPENWGRGSLISWDPQFYVTPVPITSCGQRMRSKIVAMETRPTDFPNFN